MSIGPIGPGGGPGGGPCAGLGYTDWAGRLHVGPESVGLVAAATGQDDTDCNGIDCQWRTASDGTADSTAADGTAGDTADGAADDTVAGGPGGGGSHIGYCGQDTDPDAYLGTHVAAGYDPSMNC